MIAVLVDHEDQAVYLLPNKESVKEVRDYYLREFLHLDDDEVADLETAGFEGIEIKIIRDRDLKCEKIINVWG